MAKKGIIVSGMDEAIGYLDDLQRIEGLMKATVYEGASVVVKELENQINQLKTTRYYGTEQRKRYCRPRDKEWLLEGLGITKIQVGEKVNVKVGFGGYYLYQSDDEGFEADERRPIPLLANSINAGTSFMVAQSFIDRTVRICSKKAIDAMAKQFEKSINQKSKDNT